MKASKIYLLAAGFLVAGFSVQAQVTEKAVLPDLYKGDAVPGTGWTKAVLDKNVNDAAGEVTDPTADGTLKLKAGEAKKYTQLGWFNTELDLTGDKGYTFEIKAKIKSAESNNAFSIQAFDTEGKGFRISLYNDAVVENTNPVAPKNVLKEADNTDDFHTFRIAVQANGYATVYRDKVYMGRFKVADFYFDNFFANGGFEEADLDGWDFPRGTNEISDKNAYTGEKSLFSDNGGANDSRIVMKHQTLPLKNGATYDMSYAFVREEVAPNENNWWRDFIFNMHEYEDKVEDGSWQWKENARTYEEWQTRSNSVTNTYNKPLMYFCQLSDTGNLNKTSFDDIYMGEVLSPIGRALTNPNPDKDKQPTAPPVGKTNLFVNGNFEDLTKDNKGEDYVWALASQSKNAADDNYPVAWSDAWGAYVRLQDVKKGSDTGDNFTHSGSYALRFSYLRDENHAKTFVDNFATNYPDVKYTIDTEANGMPQAQNMNYSQDLEPNKTYRLSFWFKGANYPDAGSFFVGLNDQKIFGGSFNQAYAVDWKYQEVTFSTTADEYTLRLFTEFTDWYNFYLDDIELYEVDPSEDVNAPKNFFFFGKGNGVELTDVEVEYITFDTSGAYAPYAPATDADLTGIKVDGKDLAAFDAAELKYKLSVQSSYEGLPAVTATAKDTKADVVITQITEFPGKATITITAEDGTTTKTYEIEFTKWNVGLDDVASSVAVVVTDNVLTVSGADANTAITVFDVSGKLVAQTVDTTIALPAKGVYLVKVGEQVFKVANN